MLLGVRHSLLPLAAAALLTTTDTNASQVTAGQALPTPCRYEASIGWKGDVGGRRQKPSVHVGIDHWTSSETEDQLVVTLATGSRHLFLEALTKAEAVGLVSLPDGSSYVLRYAQEHILDSGFRQVIVAADRPFESLFATSNAEYPFGFVEILMYGNGIGDGRFARAGRAVVRRDAQRIDLEAAPNESIRLANVYRICDQR